jgi:hypothetical protein
MKKKRKKGELNNLVDMDVGVLALVDKGANDKTFHLFKREETKTMNKELAIKLLKAAGLTEDEKEEILSQLSDEDRAAVEKAVDVDVDKRGARLNKDILAKLDQVIKVLEGIKGVPAEGDTKGDKDKKKVEKEDKDDPEMSDEEFAAMVKDEIGYEFEGKERPKTKPEEIIANAFKELAGQKN